MCTRNFHDSTLVVARQFADKNKYTLSCGEYQGVFRRDTIRLERQANVPRGSVVVTAGGVTLVENSD